MKILFIDDDENRINLFKNCMDNTLTGPFTIDHAVGYEDAVDLVFKSKYDIVCIDHDLGEIADGADIAYEIVQAKKMNGFNPKLIWVHTWNSAGANDIMSLLMHEFDCMKFPFSENTACMMIKLFEGIVDKS